MRYARVRIEGKLVVPVYSVLFENKGCDNELKGNKCKAN